jgi:putative MFS transporter
MLGNNWLSFSFHASGGALSDTHPRRRSASSAYSWSRFPAIFSGFVIAFFLDRYGTPGVFGFIAGAMLVVFAVISAFGPAVTQRRLEAITA